MRGIQSAILLLLNSLFFTCYAQGQPDKDVAVIELPSRFFNRVQNKTADMGEQLTHQTEKYLRRMARKEAKLRQRLYELDSAKAAGLYAGDPEQQYALLLAKLRSDTARSVHSMGPEYMPYTDSLQASL